MPTPYQNYINLLQNGQPVDAPTTNVPLSQLASRDDALKALLDALTAGASLLAVDQTIDASLPIGSPVYLGPDGILHLAATALAADAAGGVIAASSYVRGILVSLSSPTSGTIALAGRVTGIALSTWALIIDNATATPGHYWLSSTTPGQISLSVGPLAIYIGQLTADGTMFLKIGSPNYGAHEHFHFVLSGAPAGTVVDPGTGVTQTIATPDATQPGWLPAAAPYFPTGWIPAGAKFGYNFGVTSAAALKAAFPPLPNDGLAGTQGGRAIPSSQLVANDFGLWWMTNAYGTAPWPVDYVASGDVSTPIDLFFVQLQAATDTAIVTSLGVSPTNVVPLAFVDASGNPATGGRLFLSLPTLLTSSSTTDDGAVAVKSITGGHMTTGPVVSHLIPGPGVTLTPGASDTVGAYGDVVISAASADALQGSADLVSLNNAQNQFIADIAMATLPQGRNVSPVFSLSVSPLAPTTARLTLSLWLYASISGNIPAGFAVSYRIVPPPSVLTNLPTGWSALSWTMTTIAVGAGQSQVVASPIAIPNVPAGAIVLIKVVRNGVSDGFAGDIGIIQLGYTLQ